MFIVASFCSTLTETFSKLIPFTPAFSVTCIGDVFRPSLDIPSFDMLCKRLKDLLPVKLAIFPVISGTNDEYMKILTSNEWRRLGTPDLRDNSNDFSVVDRLSMVTSGRIGPLPLSLIFERCEQFVSHRMTSWSPNLSLMSNKSIFHD